MGSIEQVIRIGLQLGAGLILGDAIANSAETQAAIGGVISVGTFAWWLVRNRKKA